MPPTRRDYLAALAAASVGAAGCIAGEGNAGSTTAEGSPGGTTEAGACEPAQPVARDETILGDFETGLEGWRANGETELSQVTAEEIPGAVASGERALAVLVRGEDAPTLANEDRARRADFANNRYLHLHVIATALDSDADLEFRVRLYVPGGCDATDGGTSTSRDIDVVESDPVEVPQIDSRRIQWDLSQFPSEMLSATRRLELTWQPTGGRSTSGGERESSTEVDYRQLVAIDDVRLSEDEPVSDAQRLQQKRMDLNREHGMIVGRETDVLNETFERGRFEYSDGYNATYTYEVLDENPYRARYTLDGETFYLGNESR